MGDIPADSKNLEKTMKYINENISDETFAEIMKKSLQLRCEDLKYENLSGKDKFAADTGAWHIKVSIAMEVFVVFCFLTECIPLPGVTFCIGLILVFTGVVTRQEVAMLYWSDACWFIVESLMFAAAFVKQGMHFTMCKKI